MASKGQLPVLAIMSTDRPAAGPTQGADVTLPRLRTALIA
jgi:hypothetical protein